MSPAVAAAAGQLFLAPTGELFRAPPGEPYPVIQWFRAADADGDGRLTRAEFLADGKRFFATLDVNGDGELDGFEVEAHEKAILATLPGGEAPLGPGQPAAAASRPRKPAGPQPSRAGRFALFDVPQPVKAADRNLNARVTREEYLYVLAIRFQRLDPEGRGFLLVEALPETPAQAAAGGSGAAPPPRP